MVKQSPQKREPKAFHPALRTVTVYRKLPIIPNSNAPRLQKVRELKCFSILHFLIKYLYPLYAKHDGNPTLIAETMAYYVVQLHPKNYKTYEIYDLIMNYGYYKDMQIWLPLGRSGLRMFERQKLKPYRYTDKQRKAYRAAYLWARRFYDQEREAAQYLDSYLFPWKLRYLNPDGEYHVIRRNGFVFRSTPKDDD